jgi:hypothetical protein
MEQSRPSHTFLPTRMSELYPSDQQKSNLAIRTKYELIIPNTYFLNMNKCLYINFERPIFAVCFSGSRDEHERNDKQVDKCERHVEKSRVSDTNNQQDFKLKVKLTRFFDFFLQIYTYCDYDKTKG